MEITQKFTDALTRQANEAVRISSRSGHELLNSKSEFNHPPLARVVVERKKKVAKITKIIKTHLVILFSPTLKWGRRKAQ